MEEKRRTNSGRNTNTSVRRSSTAKRKSSRSAHSGKKRSNRTSGKGSSNRNRSVSNSKNNTVRSNTDKRVQSKKSLSKRQPARNTYVGKTKRNSKRTNMIYYIVIVLLVLVIAGAVCFGFLFKAENIEIDGDVSKYTDEQIVSAGNLKYGDILAGINGKKTGEEIESQLAYIEDAQIKKKFPSTLLITVTEAKPMAVVETPQVRYIISDSYKVVDALAGNIPENLILIKGLNVTEGTIGYKIKFENNDFVTNLERLIKSLNKNKLPVRAIEVDESGYFKANYGERIIIDFGNITDVDHKVKMAKKIIENEIAVTDKGILYLSQENQSSFRIDMGNLGIQYKINNGSDSAKE